MSELIDINILKSIFYGRELTFGNGCCILNKWLSSEKEISISVHTTNYLINNCVLVIDSSNFDTGESHYIFNTSVWTKGTLLVSHSMYIEFKSILRELNLNSLCI
jgi:hypothetical protein